MELWAQQSHRPGQSREVPNTGSASLSPSLQIHSYYLGHDHGPTQPERGEGQGTSGMGGDQGKES